MKSRIVDLLSGYKQAATLIGWSLGGLYARELSKLMVPNIRQVITMGAPFNAEADYTNVGWLFRWLNGSALTIDPALSLRLRTPPPVRTISIYSRSDGVLARHCRVAFRGFFRWSRRNRFIGSCMRSALDSVAGQSCTDQALSACTSRPIATVLFSVVRWTRREASGGLPKARCMLRRLSHNTMSLGCQWCT